MMSRSFKQYFMMSLPKILSLYKKKRKIAFASKLSWIQFIMIVNFKLNKLNYHNFLCSVLFCSIPSNAKCLRNIYIFEQDLTASSRRFLYFRIFFYRMHNVITKPIEIKIYLLYCVLLHCLVSEWTFCCHTKGASKYRSGNT